MWEHFDIVHMQINLSTDDDDDNHGGDDSNDDYGDPHYHHTEEGKDDDDDDGVRGDEYDDGKDYDDNNNCDYKIWFKKYHSKYFVIRNKTLHNFFLLKLIENKLNIGYHKL